MGQIVLSIYSLSFSLKKEVDSWEEYTESKLQNVNNGGEKLDQDLGNH